MKLLTPITINKTEISNRIVMSAINLNYAENGFVTERLIRFYEERARGEAGLLIVGGAHADEHAYWSMVSINDDKYIPGLRELTARLQRLGAKVGCQLYQAGRYMFSASSGIQAVAPSPVLSPLTGELPRELETSEVYEIIRKFGMAARRSREAGFDLVEVIGSAGYLISQFLSPTTNLRTDEFGGSPENRMRLGVEIVREVRRQTGNDFPVSFRFTGHELVPGGTPEAELIAFAKSIEQAGADLINVTGGWHESRIPQLTMNVPDGAFVYLAQQVKQAVKIPVVASNRINDPQLAERILVNHQADMITFARGLVADPELPRKTREGRFSEIRKCVGCNQGCTDNVFSSKIVECLVNAQAGHECEIEVAPAARQKRVLVIGGGPGGMEAARVASIRGHEVALWERSDCLGGQLHLAAAPPGRSDFMHFADYLKESLRVLNVAVDLGKTADAENVRTWNPDVLILATGASPIAPRIPGADKSHVIQAWDLLRQPETETGDHVVVIGGGAVGCETALHLARIGTISPETLEFLLHYDVESPEKLYQLSAHGIKHVTLIEQQPKIAQDIGKSTRWVILSDLKRFGIQVLTGTQVVKICDGEIVVEKDGKRSTIKTDTVVLAVGARPEAALYNQLQAAVPEVYLIGDAAGPRKIMNAVREGFHLGNRI